jgi:hypothetical protein
MAVAVALKLLGTDKKLAVRSEEEATVQLAPQAYLDGVAQRERGDDAAARASFERLLAEHPEHGAGAYELFQIAVRAGDIAGACSVVGQAVANLDREGDRDLVRQVWLDLYRLVPQPTLDARTWLTVANSFRATDPATALVCYEGLAAQDADGPLHAKALLEAGRMHIALHDRPSARRVLAELTRSHPGTPFDEQARALMREYGLDALETGEQAS